MRAFPVIPPVKKSAGSPGRKPPTEVLEHLLDTAFEAFAAHGYEGASMRQIASDAGTTIQRVIYHFPSKEALWKGVMTRVVQRFDQRHRQVLNECRGEPASVKLHRLIVDMVHFLAEFPGVHRIMTFEATILSPRLQWLYDNLLMSRVGETVGIIKAAQREGAVRQIDPTRLYYAILSIAAVPFTIAAEFKLTTGRDPFDFEEVEKTIALIRALIIKE
ncbi:transcriptional regulator, TetR family [Burkholderia sp. GAS332]|nr:transcriptional regulator, TetR family [Burkholderia sp. GAS332]